MYKWTGKVERDSDGHVSAPMWLQSVLLLNEINVSRRLKFMKKNMLELSLSTFTTFKGWLHTREVDLPVLVWTNRGSESCSSADSRVNTSPHRLQLCCFAFKFIVCFHTKVCVFKAGEKFGHSKKCIQRTINHCINDEKILWGKYSLDLGNSSRRFQLKVRSVAVLGCF